MLGKPQLSGASQHPPPRRPALIGVTMVRTTLPCAGGALWYSPATAAASAAMAPQEAASDRCASGALWCPLAATAAAAREPEEVAGDGGGAVEPRATGEGATIEPLFVRTGSGMGSSPGAVPRLKGIPKEAAFRRISAPGDMAGEAPRWWLGEGEKDEWNSISSGSGAQPACVGQPPKVSGPTVPAGLAEGSGESCCRPNRPTGEASGPMGVNCIGVVSPSTCMSIGHMSAGSSSDMAPAAFTTPRLDGIAKVGKRCSSCACTCACAAAAVAAPAIFLPLKWRPRCPR